MAQSSFAVRVATLVSCAATFGLAACSSDTLVPTAAPSANASLDAGGVPNGDNNGNHFGNLINKVCPTADAGSARCHSWIVVDDKGQPFATTTPAGYAPSDLQSAYNLTSLAGHGSGKTVAIVDAYDDPNAEKDLAVYRSQFGLLPCTTANGCFRKIGQTVGARLPQANASWSEEISLDLDMVSAICPNCKILLVEANSPTLANLGTAVNTAASQGAVAISNSYGGGEYSGEAGATGDETKYYKHDGVAVTASSGDSGYGVEFPAASQYVVAVGGTTLTRGGSPRGWTETAWSGAGSGCSSFVTKPGWQHDTGCSNRTVADVSAVANPNTGVAVYDTYGLSRRSAGWLVFGGTSVASPIIASVSVISGSPFALSSVYGASFFDVTSGSNGKCGSYLCTAGAGYDGPTGLGTPNGAGTF